MIIKPKNNQSIFDVLIQHQGTTIHLVDFMNKNGLNSLSNPLPSELNVGEVVSKNTYNFLKSNGIIPATYFSDAQFEAIGNFTNEFTNEYN